MREKNVQCVIHDVALNWKRCIPLEIVGRRLMLELNSHASSCRTEPENDETNRL